MMSVSIAARGRDSLLISLPAKYLSADSTLTSGVTSKTFTRRGRMFAFFRRPSFYGLSPWTALNGGMVGAIVLASAFFAICFLVSITRNRTPDEIGQDIAVLTSNTRTQLTGMLWGPELPVDEIQKLSEKRREVQNQAEILLASDFKKLKAAADTRHFARQILGFSSKLGLLWDKSQKTKELIAEFRNNVICESAIAEMLNCRFYELNEALFDVDQEGLQLLAIDGIEVDLAEKSAGSKNIDRTLASLEVVIEDGVIHSLVGDGVGIGVGLVAGNASYNAIRSNREFRSDGSVNRNAELEAAFGSFIVGLIAEFATDLILDRSGKIAVRLDKAVGEVYGPLLASDAEWKHSFDVLVASHDRAFLTAVAKARGVEASALKAAVDSQVQP